MARFPRRPRDADVVRGLVADHSFRCADPRVVLSPSSYAGANRSAMAGHIHEDTAPILLWFAVLSSLISLVIIRIVVVTA